jgi:hypothetical protein
VVPEVQVLARYEQADYDRADANDRVDRITIGVTCYLKGHYAKIQSNYQFNGEQGESIANDEFLMNFQVGF